MDAGWLVEQGPGSERHTGTASRPSWMLPASSSWVTRPCSASGSFRGAARACMCGYKGVPADFDDTVALSETLLAAMSIG